MMYLTYYNLLIAQNLWQAHYQILSVLFIKEFRQLIANRDMMIKYMKLLELYMKYVTAIKAMNAQTLEII